MAHLCLAEDAVSDQAASHAQRAAAERCGRIGPQGECCFSPAEQTGVKMVNSASY